MGAHPIRVPRGTELGLAAEFDGEELQHRDDLLHRDIGAGRNIVGIPQRRCIKPLAHGLFGHGVRNATVQNVL